ncbi:helicase associated domain-containing protein [Streptomyces microflavus]|uniref:helicase associated domain-containing protein n=1 Tax=Streptomyces microflavus TaxID=1919 RepID=UPI0037FFF388
MAAARTTKEPRKGPSKAQAAFERGLAALTHWVEREGGDRPVPRSAVIEVKAAGASELVPVRLGVWLSNTRTRRDRLTADQLDALAKLGMDWARPVTVPQVAPDSP